MGRKASRFQEGFRKIRRRFNVERTNSLIIDGVIQRFEFNYELVWRVIKYYLEYQELEVKSPRSTFKEAFTIGLIENGDEWIDMLNDRNLTSYVYDEETWISWI